LFGKTSKKGMERMWNDRAKPMPAFVNLASQALWGLSHQNAPACYLFCEFSRARK
jgi:hypothetical protein